MKEPLESSQAESLPQDKKNYATKGADENVISANNSNADSITITDEKQIRVDNSSEFRLPLD